MNVKQVISKLEDIVYNRLEQTTEEDAAYVERAVEELKQVNPNLDFMESMDYLSASAFANYMEGPEHLIDPLRRIADAIDDLFVTWALSNESTEFDVYRHNIDASLIPENLKNRLGRVIAMIKQGQFGDIVDTLEKLESNLLDKDSRSAAINLRRINSELHKTIDDIDYLAKLSKYDYEYKELLNAHTYFIDMYPHLEGLISNAELDETYQLFNMLVDYL